MSTRPPQRLSSVDAGWDESTRAPPSRPQEGRSADEETRSIPIDELDALLESAGSGCEGATTSLTSGELDELLVPGGPGSGFGQRPSAPAPRSASGALPPVNLDDEVGAAFDAMEGPTPMHGAEHDADRDSQPTSIDAYPPDSFPTSVVHRADQLALPSPSQPATVELHAWSQEGEPATVDLGSWRVGTQDPTAAAAPAHAPPIAPPIAPWPPPPPPSQAPPARPAPSPQAQYPSRPSGPQAAPPFQDQGEPTFSGGAQGSSRAGMIAALAMSTITVVGITAYLLQRSPEGQGTPGATASSAPAPSAGTGAGSGAPLPRGEAEARAALRRLGEGVVTCARGVIGVLPGTSSAVPSSFRAMKEGLYTSLPGDYRSPVWSCTGFRQAEPQPFQIQWQIFKGGAEGMAIAWLDTNGDGTADRAFGLRATLVKRGEVALASDIELLEPVPPVAATR